MERLCNDCGVKLPEGTFHVHSKSDPLAMSCEIESLRQKLETANVEIARLNSSWSAANKQCQEAVNEAERLKDAEAELEQLEAVNNKLVRRAADAELQVEALKRELEEVKRRA